MKRVSFYSTFLFSMFFMLFSSCSLIQQTEFAKRKYYNFPHSKNSVVASASEKFTKNPEPTITAAVNSNKDELVPDIKTKTVYLSQSPVISYRAKNQPHAPVILTEKPKTNSSIVSEQKTIEIPPLMKKPSSAGSDAVLILELILAIFIPPLAVYIHNQRIDRWFWVTLILCLAGGAFMAGTYTGYFGLFWAAAVVIAICYVLGIIRS